MKVSPGQKVGKEQQQQQQDKLDVPLFVVHQGCSD